MGFNGEKFRAIIVVDFPTLNYVQVTTRSDWLEWVFHHLHHDITMCIITSQCASIVMSIQYNTKV